MQKPNNKNIYKALKQLPASPIILGEDIDPYDSSVHQWLLDNNYSKITDVENHKIKDIYKDQIIDMKEFGDVGLDGKQIPLERYDIEEYQSLVLSNKGIIFLNNYSNFWKKINYRFEDYHIIMPLILGFLGGIFSSLILYLIIGK